MNFAGEPRQGTAVFSGSSCPPRANSDAAPEQGEPHAGQEGHHLCSSSPEDAHLVLPGEHFQDLTQMVARVSRNLRLLRNTCLLQEIGF